MMKKMQALRKIGKKKQKRGHAPVCPDTTQVTEAEKGGYGQRRQREHVEGHSLVPGKGETKEPREGLRIKPEGSEQDPREDKSKASPARGKKEDRQECEGRTDREEKVGGWGADTDQREKLQLPDAHPQMGTAPSSPPVRYRLTKV